MGCGIFMKLLQINHILLGLFFNVCTMVAMDPPPSTLQEQLMIAARRGTAADIQRLVGAGADIFVSHDRQNSLTMWQILLSPLMIAINESLDLEDETYTAKIEIIIDAMVAKDRKQARKDLAAVLKCLEALRCMRSDDGSNPFYSRKYRLSARMGLVQEVLLKRMLPISQERLLELLRSKKTTMSIGKFLSECSNVGFNNLNSITLSALFSVRVNDRGILQLIIDSDIADYDCESKLEFIIEQMNRWAWEHLLTLTEEVVAQFVSLSRSSTKRETRIREILIRQLGYLRQELIEAIKKSLGKIDWELSRKSDDMRLISQRQSQEERLRSSLTRIDKILYNLGAETRTESQRSAEYDQLIQRPAPEQRQPNQPATNAAGGVWSYLSGL